METEYNNTFSALNKSKLDKAQARRLKMPKRNRSAYFLFSMDTRANLKVEFNNNLTPLEMQAKVSQYWKELSAEEKEKYELRAKNEKVEYLAAMEKFYSSLTPETVAKSQTNRPKKPCSAYAHFVRDVKTDLKRENPKLIMQEILHIVSDKWKNLDESIRAVYEEKARLDKEQYMAAIKKLSPESQESPKNKIQNNFNGENLGKRAMQMDDSSERAPNKQVKLESISTKSESQVEAEEPTYRLVKIEDASITSSSPYTTKPGSEVGQESAGKLNVGMNFSLEQLAPMNQMVMTGGFQDLQMPGLNDNMMTRAPNMYPNPMFGGDYEKMREMMLAKLTWARAMEANRNLEQAIARRVAEVRNLQAQQYMFAQRVLLASKVGTF